MSPAVVIGWVWHCEAGTWAACQTGTALLATADQPNLWLVGRQGGGAKGREGF